MAISANKSDQERAGPRRCSFGKAVSREFRFLDKKDPFAGVSSACDVDGSRTSTCRERKVEIENESRAGRSSKCADPNGGARGVRGHFHVTN